MPELTSEMGFSVNKNNKDNLAVILLKGLNNLRKEGSFCDVTLKAGERTIRVHKNVLCVCSPYFMAMFSGHFSESNRQEITLEDIDADCLELLIDFMYSGTLNIDPINVKDVLLTASFLQMSSAEELCCKLLLDNMVFDNCIEYILFAGKNSIKRLADPAIEMAILNFHRIFFKNDYLEIEFEELKQLTQMLKKNGHPEDLIFTFIMRWIKHSQETRLSYMKELLEVLDVSLISPDVLYSSEIVNTSNPILTAWTARDNTSRSSNGSGDHVLVSRRMGVFRPLRINLFTQAKHRQVNLLPDKIADGSYVCNGYYIYHQGGWKNNKELLTESDAYHPTMCAWVPFVPLQQARAYHHSCVLNGRIYSVGGSDGIKGLASVEFTELYTGQRGFIDPLPRAKERAGLGLHENSIYVVGGSDRGNSYKCIHRFDGREGVWQELAPSPYRAGATSCAVLADNIYTTHPDTLQRYDIRANNWTMISAQYKRYPPEVFALDNVLFGLFNDHVARFITEGGKWENQRTLKCNLPYLQVSPNLRFPMVNEEDITDPVFDGNYPRSDDESETEGSDDDE